MECVYLQIRLKFYGRKFYRYNISLQIVCCVYSLPQMYLMEYNK